MKNNRLPIKFRTVLLLSCVTFFAFSVVFPAISGLMRQREKSVEPGAALLAPALSATKTDSLATDANGNGFANPGDALKYTITVGNGGADPATNANLTDQIDANTTLVGGSLKISPRANPDSYNAVGNTPITVNAANGLRANDSDVDSVTPTNSLIISAGTFATAQGGSITVAADGSFTYVPQTGDQNLTDTFVYTIKDSDNLSATGTATFNVGQRVWYVDATYAGANGASDGSFLKPYATSAQISGAAGSDAAGDIIYVYERSGDYDGNLTLLNNQQLLGSGVPLVVTVNSQAITVVAASANTTLVATAASSNSITLAQNNTVRGFTIGNTTGAAIAGTNFGTFTADTISKNGSGQALNLSTGTANATFTTLTSTSGANNVNLSAVSGTLRTPAR